MGTVALTAPEVREGILQSTFPDANHNGRVRRFNVVFSSSYATGGDTVPVATLGLRNVNRILVEGSGPFARPGFSVELGGTSSAPKLLAWETANTEVANATDLSARGISVVWFIGD